MNLKEINNQIAILENEKINIFLTEMKSIFELYPNYSIELSCYMDYNDEGGTNVYLSEISELEEMYVDEELVNIDENSPFEIKDFLNRIEEIITEMNDEYLYDKYSNDETLILDKNTF